MIFFQGHDTTSASICWTLFLLGSSPEIQDRVYEEIDSIFEGDRKRSATMKDLNEMKYLECAIKDSLRLYPSVPFLGRHLYEDVQIGTKIHYILFRNSSNKLTVFFFLLR